jgi:hypothetical protein
MLSLVEIITVVQSGSPDRRFLTIHQGKGVRRRQRSSHLPCERIDLFGGGRGAENNEEGQSVAPSSWAQP